MVYLFYQITCVIVVVTAFVMIFRLNRGYANLPILIGLVSALPSVLIIENGAYMSELEGRGEFNGATLALIIYLCIFFAGWGCFALSGWGRIDEKNHFNHVEKSANLIDDILFYILLIFILIWIASVLINWPPVILLNKGVITRFNGPAAGMQGKVFTFIPIALGYYSYVIKRKRDTLLLFALYILLLIANGHKFGGVVMAFYFLYYGKYRDNYNLFVFELKKNALKIILFGIAVMLLVLFHYKNISDGFGISKYELLYERIFVMQGQLWYAVFDKASLFECVRGCIESTESNMINMTLFALPNANESELLEGLSGKLTYGFPSVLIYKYGLVYAVGLCFFIGIGVGLLLKFHKFLSNYFGLVGYLFAVYLQLMVFEFCATGDYTVFVDNKGLFILVGSVLLYAFRMVIVRLK